MKKGLKVMYWLFLVSFTVWIVQWCSRKSDEKTSESLEKLKNDVEFSGIVKNKFLSNNHGFGVVELRIIKSNVDYFNQENFPYRIEKGTGELYSIVSSVDIGDTIRVVSNESSFYFNYENRNVKGEIYMIGPLDIGYIKKNTIFKN
ncbi:hypothetical protein Lbys_2436 [Leadbetterella byssophila DSM 17132]|uniref:Uncharacterized protein n=1 Tax=Leadbetterella byssophila (strain DSM 17132 / JCM 16389 / KACC 11308 / NBRC 106382 / 4M15) TaxID=649349 RepID=E4RXP0_LEAB4|nr:hypothetical protein [Leadbetterella byssophila]ADQ18104.1 hypothetical protein Lbys_2436 [Leadbetterella byssophila DSM 17132]